LASRSCRGEGDVQEIAARLVSFETIGDHPQGECLDVRDGFIPCRAIGEDSGQLNHFSDPALLTYEVFLHEPCVIHGASEDLWMDGLARMAREGHAAAEVITQNPMAASLAYHLEPMLLERSLDLPRSQTGEARAHPGTSTVIRLIAST